MNLWKTITLSDTDIKVLGIFLNNYNPCRCGCAYPKMQGKYPEEYDMRKKLLDYIFDREIEELQYDQAFEEFKRKPQPKEYNFHGGDIFDGDC